MQISDFKTQESQNLGISEFKKFKI